MPEATRAPYIFRGTALPEHLRESIDAYVKDGRPTGDFLQAVIENDLAGALARADDDNLGLIHVIVNYLRWECQSGCWGAKGKFDRWIEAKRKEKGHHDTE